MRRQHPTEYNAALPTPTLSHTRWTPEEEKQLAFFEASFIKYGDPDGGKFVNQFLLKKFPDRTLESIKSHRKQEKYKLLVQGLLKDLETREDSSSSSSTPPFVTPRTSPAESRSSSPARPSQISFSPASERYQLSPSPPRNTQESVTSSSSSTTEPCPVFNSSPIGGFNNTSFGIFNDNDSFGNEMDETLPDPDQILKTDPIDNNDPMLALVKDCLTDLLHRKPQSSSFNRDLLMTIVRRSLLNLNITYDMEHFVRQLCDLKCKKSRPVMAVKDRKGTRAAHYGRIQKLYSDNRQRLVKQILNPDIGEGCDLPFKDVESFWKSTFAPDDAPTLDGCPAEASVVNPWHEVFGPITSREITENYPDLGKAPGPDGFTSRALRRIPVWHLECLFNLFILARDVPACMKLAKTILIPKKTAATSPGEFRPITLSPILLRHFHKIIYVRISTLVEHHRNQRAFIAADGCSEASSTIYTVIEDAKKNRNSLHMAFLDVRKAFDSVEFRSIIKSMAEKGAPPQFTRYLYNLYAQSSTTLLTRFGSSDIKPTRGVRQGDPLSPLLFNCIIDKVLSSLPDRTGYTLKHPTDSTSSSINSIAFADDLVLIASTRNGLQELLDITTSSLHESGLHLNPDKCKSLSILPLSKDKKFKVADTPFYVDDRAIPSTGFEETITYLGLPVNSLAHISPLKLLEEYCGRLSSFPLKPHQKLVIFIYHIIPKLLHPLVLSNLPVHKLKGLDIMTRRFVKKWLHLPHDFPTGVIHASKSKGGLGVPCLVTTVAWLKIKRRSRLMDHPLPLFRLIGNMPFVQEDIKKCYTLLTNHLQTTPSEESLGAFELSRLVKTYDGLSLKEAYKTPAASDWVHNFTKKGHLVGRDYIGMIHARYNCLPTRSRVWRGRSAPPRYTVCRAGCNHSETLNHISQVCPRTHGIRVKRHDRILDILCKRFNEEGWNVEREKRYRLPGHTLIPDITMTKPGEPYRVLDLQVVGDSAVPLDRRCDTKIAKYKDDEQLSSRLTKDGQPPIFAAITVNFKGVMAPSTSSLLTSLGLNRRDINIVASSAVYGTYASWGIFMRSTARGRGHVWSPTGE